MISNKPAKQSPKHRHSAILIAQALSYALIITFIFANEKFDLIGIFRPLDASYGSGTAYLAACLIGIVGAISIWLTWYYASKSSSIRDMLVICAWTHRVKSNGRWVSLEEFLTHQLGYVVSHGLSEAKLAEMGNEVDREWRHIKLKETSPTISSDQRKNQFPFPPLSEDRLDKRRPSLKKGTP